MHKEILHVFYSDWQSIYLFIYDIKFKFQKKYN